MRFTAQWIGVLLAVAAIDLLVRFGGFSNYGHILWIEAFLFPGTGLVLYLVFRSHPRSSPFMRGLQTVLIWGFILAGLRAGIWASGFAVGVANLVIFLVAFLAWLGLRIAKRRKSDGT